MTAESFEKALIAVCDAEPFRAFTIELQDGRRFEIDHPMAFRGGVAGYLGRKGTPLVFRHNEVNQIIPSPESATAQ